MDEWMDGVMTMLGMVITQLPGVSSNNNNINILY